MYIILHFGILASSILVNRQDCLLVLNILEENSFPFVLQLTAFTVPRGFCVTNIALERQLQHYEQLQNLIADIVDISRCKREEDLESYCQKYKCRKHFVKIAS